MAVKASNQKTLMDLTDGYSVILTNDNYTFLGDTDSVSGTQSTTCQIQALQGANQVACDVGEITTPTGTEHRKRRKDPDPHADDHSHGGTEAVRQRDDPGCDRGHHDQQSLQLVDRLSVARTARMEKTGTSVTVTSTSVTYQVGCIRDDEADGAVGAPASQAYRPASTCGRRPL